jgi:translation initiation factor 1
MEEIDIPLPIDNIWSSNPNEFDIPLPIDELIVHIRMYKRNGRNCVTIIEGLDYDKTMISKISKLYSCGGSYDKQNCIYKFSGDVRRQIATFLIESKLVDKNNIKIHGY